MLEAGKNRYQIAKEMQFTFGGATYRQSAWIKEGGVARNRIAIEARSIACDRTTDEIPTLQELP